MSIDIRFYEETAKKEIYPYKTTLVIAILTDKVHEGYLVYRGKYENS